MKQKLIIKTDPDMPLLPVHGVLGGVTRTGEIEMLLYTDTDALPAPRELLLAEDGSLVNEEKAEGNSVAEEETRIVQRNVHTRTVMTGDQARLLAGWLLKQLDILDEVETKTANPEDLPVPGYADMEEGKEDLKPMDEKKDDTPGRNSKKQGRGRSR